MRNLDFSSWHALLSTVVGLGLITLIMVGVRLLAMHTVQKRRERENRQINERLRTLIAAYKTLGGSFTGDLSVDPTHLRDLRRVEGESHETIAQRSDRSRRMRDAVEAALSDIILLGTEEQVALAARAATELSEGRPTHTAALVVSLRDFIRKVLDLEAVPANLAIPKQGPTRISATRGKGEGKGEGGGKGAGGGMGGMGAGMGGMGSHASLDNDQDAHR
ncbi:hypothetical protein ACN9MB_19915 [Dyella kyungheensis]|uniref:hypothetical protein n=1 Tax=Dyella kyungheensis TaxID=1242174 RepID=UPI003CECAD62